MSGVFEYPEEVVYERVAAHKALVAERDELRATVARVEALADRLAQIHNRLHGDVEINRQEHRRGERDLARWLHDDLRAALAGESDG